MSLRAAIMTMMLSFLFAAPSAVLSYQKYSDIAIFDDLESKELPPPVYPSHEPFNGSISIESDSEFTSENGVSSGSGTQNDPYIIENLSFEVGTVPAIRIANTTAHLVIRNITLSGGRDERIESVSFYNCSNITISGSAIVNGFEGLYVRSCSQVSVLDCSFDNCVNGILALVVTQFSLRGNILTNNGLGCRMIGSCDRCVVSENEVRGNFGGILLQGVFTGLDVVRNNISKNDENGLYCDGLKGQNIVIRENDIKRNSGFGAFLEYCQVLNLTGNSIIENPNGGILGEGLYGNGVNISSNEVSGNGIYGMELQIVKDIVIWNNNVTGHANIGIYLGSGSIDNKVVGNYISGNDYTGLLLGYGANGNIVFGNNISGNYVGCYVQPSSEIAIEGNLFVGNTDHDCILDGISRSSMEGNSIRTTKSGLVVTGSDHLDVVSNRFYGTGTVLWLDQSYKVSVLDNAFHSTGIQLDQYSEVSWNLPQRAVGKNMIGGPFRHGNYWVDYKGQDIDGDGIGDTDLPHGPGDTGPLVKDYPPPDTEPPTIIMTNFDVPVTGEVWTGRFKVHDNRSMFGVKLPQSSFIQYDIYGNVIHELTEKDVSYDDKGRFSRTIDVRPSAVGISVNISAIDFSGNRIDTKFHLDVEDPIPPDVLEMDYPSEVDAGGELLIILDLTDNVGIGSVEAIFDLGKTIAPLNASGVPLNDRATKWSVSIDVPEEALETEVEITISDISGNKKVIQIVNISVRDSLPPFLEDRTVGRPRTGEPFEMTFLVRDNHAVSSLVLLTSQDGIDGAPKWGEVPLNGSAWRVQVPIKTTATELTFTLKVEDRSGNEQELRGGYSVIDTIEPVIKRIDTNEPTTGEAFEMHLIISDNWGTFNGELEWWFDNGQAYVMELPMERAVIPQVPASAAELHYIVRVEDGSANTAELGQLLQVKDSIPPSMDIDFFSPKTSSQWQVYLSPSDNRGIGRIKIDRSFDDGPIVSNEYTDGQNNVTLRIDVPDDAWRVRIDCLIEDVTGLITTYTRTVDIADGTPPVITNHTMRKMTGGDHEISVTARDNREVSMAWLVLMDGDGKEKKVLMKEMGSGGYAIRMPSERLEGYRNYTIIVEDGSGLTARTGSMDLDVQGKGGNLKWTIVVIIVLLAAIIMILLLLTLVRGWLHGAGRTNGQGPVWLSKGTGDMTRPREVILPQGAMEE